MNKKLRVVVIVLGVLVALVVAMVAAGAYWLKQYKETEFPEVEFIVPEGGVQAIVDEYESYPPDPAPDAVVAKVGEEALTNAELQVYFWAQVAAHMETDAPQPDLRVPLKWQRCAADSTVENWEEYFLLKAVDSWHGAVALALQGNDEGLPLEERYSPVEKYHEQYLTDKPATELLYGYNTGYRTNTLHENFIAALPELLDELAAERGYADGEALAQTVFGTTEAAVLAAAETYNRGYSYYTALSYIQETPDTEAVEDGTPVVSFRHVLLRPVHPKWYPKRLQQKEEQVEYNVDELGRVTCVETGWKNCMSTAKNMLRSWQNSFLTGEYSFGQMAYESSVDEGSRLHGGYYANVPQGKVLPVLDEWLFDPARQVGDTTVLRSEFGVHILYFSAGSTLEQNAAADTAVSRQLTALVEQAKVKYPMDTDLSKAAVQPGTDGVTMSDLLYGDIAHERFPEVPLYLQRDYGNTMYGNYKLATHGCGITSMAMMATYLADEEWTPPELCDIFGSYCGLHGTDVRLFWQANSKLGYLYREYTYDDDYALQALKDGYLVVAKETAGYWTRGGHYIVLERVTEDGKIVVRDSNIFNFGPLEGHKVDCFDWDLITPQAAVYFIMGKKPTHIASCTRCGDPTEQMEVLMGDGYLCHNCDTALLRRDTFLAATN